MSSVRAALRLRVVSATPARLEPRRDAMQLATVPRRPKAWGPVRPIAPALWGDSLLPGRPPSHCRLPALPLPQDMSFVGGRPRTQSRTPEQRFHQGQEVRRSPPGPGVSMRPASRSAPGERTGAHACSR